MDRVCFPNFRPGRAHVLGFGDIKITEVVLLVCWLNRNDRGRFGEIRGIRSDFYFSPGGGAWLGPGPPYCFQYNALNGFTLGAVACAPSFSRQGRISSHQAS